MKKPVGSERFGELLLPPKDSGPVENLRLPFRKSRRKLLDLEETLAQPFLRFGNGVVSGPVVDQVDVHSALDQVPDHRRDDVTLVVCRQKGDHPEGRGHTRSVDELLTRY